MKMKNSSLTVFFIVIATTILIQSCHKEKNPAETIAEDFLSSIYNYDFERASTLSTTCSQKWIKFQASNVTQAELDTKPCVCTYSNILSTSSQIMNDSITKVTCSLDKVAVKSLQTDSIEFATIQTTVNVIKRGDKWLVKMEGPLQNGM